MNRTHWYFLAAGVGVGVVVAIAAIFTAFSLYAGNGRASSLPASAAPVPRVVQDVSNRTSEGFEVHGHWTLEIREPDGTLVKRREFDNALLFAGKEALTKILSRQKTGGNWRIHIASAVSGGTGIKTCEAPGTVQVSDTILCIAEESESDTDPRISKTLTVEGDTIQRKVILSGNGLAQLDGEIRSVATQIKLCDSSASPDACSSPDSSNDVLNTTATTLEPTEPVEEGQQIIATVELSFE